MNPIEPASETAIPVINDVTASNKILTRSVFTPSDDASSSPNERISSSRTVKRSITIAGITKSPMRTLSHVAFHIPPISQNMI